MEKSKNKPKKDIVANSNLVLFALVLVILVILKSIFSPPAANNVANNVRHKTLEQEAISALDKLANGKDSIRQIDSNKLVEKKFEFLEQMDYKEFKQALGLENDFCIYFEDYAGSIIAIGNIKSGIGSGKIMINGEPCIEA